MKAEPLAGLVAIGAALELERLARIDRLSRRIGADRLRSIRRCHHDKLGLEADLFATGIQRGLAGR